jgi:diguanylate cyclase (GGDEF)-like protein
VVILISLSILVTVYLMIVTFLHCRSEKRYYFMLCMTSIFLYLSGNLLEITAFSTAGSLIAVKLMYMGGCFLPVFYLLFAADYCDIEILQHRLKPFLFIPPAISLPIIFTAEYHNMMYASYHFDNDTPLLGLQIEEGSLYYFIYGYIVLYIAAGCVILINTLPKRREQFKSFMLLTVVLSAPLAATFIHILCSNVFQNAFGDINFTPFALVVTNVLFYISIVRYDLFDIVPTAYSMTLDYIRDAFVLVSSDMNYTSSNRAARRLFPDLDGLRKGAAIAQISNWPGELLAPSDYSEELGVRFTLPDKSGDDRYFSAQIDAIFTGGKPRLLGWIILIQDITNIISMMKKLEQVAYTDVLTGLYNRRHFMELAAMLFDRSKRSGISCHVMMMDLDFFKNINDTYGHLAGDEVLKNVSACIKETVRSYDLVARYGGEEFVVMISDSDEQTALRLAERIRTHVEDNPCIYEGRSLTVTFSIGVASTRDIVSFEDMLRCADEAMYTAKKNGRNRVVPYIGSKPDSEQIG